MLRCGLEVARLRPFTFHTVRGSISPCLSGDVSQGSRVHKKDCVATPRARHFRGVGPRVSGGGEALSQIGAVVGVWHVEAILALFAPPVRLRMLFRPPLQYLVPQAGLGSDVLMLPVQFAGQGRLRRLRMSMPSDPKCPGNSRHRIQTHIQVVIDRFLHTTFF